MTLGPPAVSADGRRSRTVAIARSRRVGKHGGCHGVRRAAQPKSWDGT